MRLVAERLRYLVSPLNVLKFYIDDIIEDLEYMEHKARLADIGKVAGRCLSIVRDLIGLTMPYFDSKSNK